ncbi:WxL domain-containing protein [Bacillus pfraonensis]|uniref:WxL domain-containing protein n=1 Tax=Bacillus TaxID=1386 RepID=UPI002A55773E|nr:WxL domain-containing protein [Bacillus pseudomycoides]
MKLAKLALAGAVSLTTLAGGTSAFAEEAGKMNSLTDVTFTENKEVTKPINPIDEEEEVTTPGNPDDPKDPKDPKNPDDPENPDDNNHEDGTQGPLSIDYVSNFHFGKHDISGSDKVYYAKLDIVKGKDGGNKEVPNFVQVTDNRGTNKGWKLTVKQNGQFKAGNEELTGAEMKLSNPFVNSATDKKYAPEAKEVTLNPDGSTQEVATAAAGKGMGTWTTAYGQNIEEGSNSISLSVPGTTAKVKDAKYKASLTWTLEDTPQ